MESHATPGGWSSVSVDSRIGVLREWLDAGLELEPADGQDVGRAQRGEATGRAMTFWLSAVVVVGVGFVLGLLSRAERGRVERLRVAAERHETAGRYEEACYHYAEAAGGRPRHPLAERVRQLWRERGPFTFEAVRERVVDEYCECCSSCGEGYHEGVLQGIRRIVGTSMPGGPRQEPR